MTAETTPATVEASVVQGGGQAQAAADPSPFEAPLQFPPAREAPPPPPAAADSGPAASASPSPASSGGADAAGASAGSGSSASSTSSAATDEDGGASAAADTGHAGEEGGGDEEETRAPRRPKAAAEERAERNRRQKAADGYAMMFSAFDQELVDMLLWDRMTPAELTEERARHELHPDIKSAISFTIEQTLEEYPKLAGSAGGIGMMATFYLLRVGGTVKRRIDLNSLSEAELLALRRERQAHYSQRAAERTVSVEAVDPRDEKPRGRG